MYFLFIIHNIIYNTISKLVVIIKDNKSSK